VLITISLFIFLGAFAKLRKEIIGFVMSVRLSVRMGQLGSNRTDFHEIWYWRIFRKICRKKLKFFFLNLTRITSNLHGYLFTYMITFRRILLRMRNVSDKLWRENERRHFVINNFFTRKSYRLWDNVEKNGRARKYGRTRQATDDNIIRRMRFACWITKATDTHSEYVIHIAFSRHQWSRERTSVLRLHVNRLPCY
jgi:hypothetical protein